MRSRPLLLVSLLAAVVALCPGEGRGEAETGAGPGGAQVRVDRYRGRWTGDPLFERTFSALPALVDEGLRRVNERLGLVPRDPARVLVYVLDAHLGRYGSDRARTWTRRGAQGEEHVVTLFAEYYLSGDSDLRATVVHELTHAVMRERMGREAYEALPHWVREGLAIHVADEGPAQLRRNLQVAEDAGALLTGLMGETRSLIMYPYAWLAVDLLERRAGEGSLVRFVGTLLEGRDVRSTVAALVGATPEAFEAAVHEHVRARVEAESGALGPLKDAKFLFQRRRHETARLAFETLLEAHADSCFAPTARYYRARCLSLLGRRREALEAFRLCVETDTGRSGLSDEAQLHLGMEHHVLGEDEAAVRELERYVRLHPHSTEQALGYLFLGRALRRLGRTEDAQRAYAAVPGASGAREGLRRAAAREAQGLAAGR